MENINPWTSRFEPILDSAEIVRRVKLMPSPVNGLEELPVELACTTLKNTLEGVFIPTTQGVSILQRWFGIAYSHSVITYPDKKAFQEGIYSQEKPLPDFSYPICFSGLAGLGKSELVKAFQRLQPLASEVYIETEHSIFPLKSSWRVTVNSSASPRDILSAIVGYDDTLRNLKAEARGLAFRDGIPIMFVDELQFATQSSTANTQITKMLFSVSYIGIPFVFLSNFSLLNKLMARPQEDKQRLLSDPIVLLPDTAESDDWLKLLFAYQEVAPKIMCFDLNRDSKTIHRFTAGIKRALVSLLIIAYRISRNFDGKITIREIEHAYQSPEYTVNRRDTEAIAYQIIKGEKFPHRDDLWCPIDLPKTFQQKTEQSFIEEHSKREAEGKLIASFTPEERKGYKSLVKSQENQNIVKNVIPINTKIPLTAKKLTDDAKWFNDNYEK